MIKAQDHGRAWFSRLTFGLIYGVRTDSKTKKNDNKLDTAKNRARSGVTETVRRPLLRPSASLGVDGRGEFYKFKPQSLKQNLIACNW